MKTLRTLIILGMFMMNVAISGQSQAQVRVNVNIGNQPDWGPTGYDHVDYYYFPDLDVYYQVPRHVFVYFDGGAWVTASRLPAKFGRPDFYSLYKVVVNKPHPYRDADFYRRTYGHQGGNRTSQVVIGDSHDDRYKNHYHDEYDRGHGNGDHKKDRGHEDH